ncbi:hypothetical protein BHE74_00001831 [Ensete ventricosum]|nr:hypothetical protein BHE74_00001831 [Ensete ventricosum]RZS02218.1 hypothetical protein BHM03_00032228 [Ensete ventricosum]
MLHPGVTQEWVDEGELPRERTKVRRWQRLYDVLVEATHREVIVRVRHTRICMQWRCHQEATWCSGGGIVRGNATLAVTPVRDKIMWRYDQELLGASLWCMIKAAGELDYFSTHIRLREPGKSEDKANHKRDRGGEKCRGKLQVPRQDGRAEAKELHKTDVDGFLIKIFESEGLWVDAGVLDQGMK